MKIWQKIKNFFVRMKIKKLDAPKEIELQEVDLFEKNEIKSRENELNLQIQNIIVPEFNDTEKLREILRTIGCSKESIESILEIENIDIPNFRKNLFELNSLDYSNLELTIVITQNKDLITMDNEKVKAQIQKLNNYFDNREIVKELIYSNSNILSENIEEILENTSGIFEEFGISIKEDADVIIDNSNILFIAKNKLINSLNIIRDYAKTQENFISIILNDPFIVGIQDIKVLEEYV